MGVRYATATASNVQFFRNTTRIGTSSSDAYQVGYNGSNNNKTGLTFTFDHEVTGVYGSFYSTSATMKNGNTAAATYNAMPRIYITNNSSYNPQTCSMSSIASTLESTSTGQMSMIPSPLPYGTDGVPCTLSVGAKTGTTAATASSPISISLSKGTTYYCWVSRITVSGKYPQYYFPYQSPSYFTLNYTYTAYAVSYNANGGSGSMSSYDIESGESHTILASEFTPPTGYYFSGWNTNASGTGTSYAVGSTYAFSAGADLTLYAQWSPYSYTVTAQSEDVSAVTVSGGGTYEYGDYVTLTASLVTTPGYEVTFDGWYNSQGAKVTSSLTYTFTCTGSVTYTAKATKEVLGGIYVYTGGRYHLAMVYIYTNGSYKRAVPYVYTGGRYHMCS